MLPIRYLSLFIFSFLLFSTCKKVQPIIEKVTGLVVFQNGKTISSVKELKLGDKVFEGENIKVDSRSNLELQVIVPKTQIVIKLKQNTELEFSSRKIGDQVSFFLEVKSGEALFNVDSPVQNESIQFGTPTTAIGVRGTKFSISVDSEQTTNVSLLEGKVSYRLRFPEIESLPPEVLESNLELKKRFEFLTGKEIILDQGNFIQTKAQVKKDILNELGLVEILKETNPTLIKDKISKISVNVPETKLNDLFNIKSEALPEKTRSSLADGFENLTPIKIADLDNPDLLNNIIKPRSEKLISAQMEKLEKKLGKKAETILLKNQSKIFGIIKDTGSGFMVTTTEGEILLKYDEVEEILQ